MSGIPCPKARPVPPPGGASSNDSVFTIAVVGDVNGGKSSFINSLAGALVAISSIRQETTQITFYHFKRNGNEQRLLEVASKMDQLKLQNEQQRKDAKNLKDEEVGSLHIVAGEDDPLPARFGLNGFTVMDFPGQNDAQNPELFNEVVKYRIHQIDLVIFLTDARCAFTKAAEVAELKKMLDLVSQEHKEGHYVDLIVVVNKFDNTQHPDLKDMYVKTVANLGELGVPADKVFKYSAHKMLISCVIKHKLDLYLPKSISGEIQSILQNCHVKLSDEARVRLKKEKIISWSGIKVERDVAEDLLADSDGEGDKELAEGVKDEDWNKDTGETNDEDDELSRLDVSTYMPVIEYLRVFQEKVPGERITQLAKHTKSLWEPVAAAKDEVAISNDLGRNYDRVLNTYAQFVAFGAAESWEVVIVQGWAELGKADGAAQANSPAAQQNIVRSMLRFAMDHPDIMDRSYSFGESCHEFAWDIIAWWVQFTIVQRMFKCSRYMDTLRAVFADPRAFEGVKVEVFSNPKLTSAKWQLGKGTFLPNGASAGNIEETYGTHDSWIVHNVLNSPHTPKEARIMLQLAITPAAELLAMDLCGTLPETVIKNFDKDLLSHLRYACSRPDVFPRSKPLQHRLFAMSKVKEVADFMATQARFKAMTGL